MSIHHDEETVTEEKMYMSNFSINFEKIVVDEESGETKYEMFLDDDLKKSKYGLLLTQLNLIVEALNNFTFNNLINLSEEEFNKLKTNFNIVSLGKLSCTYDRYKRIKLREKYKNGDIEN